MNYIRRYAIILALLLGHSGTATTADAPLEPEAQPVISIIIDDLGNRLEDGKKALELPGAITYSFLPHTPYARTLAEQAHNQDKEVMLHLPMDAHSGKQLGPGGLTLNMTKEQFQETLKENLQVVPHVAGLNNHMGSLLTRHPGAMGWLMQGILDYGDLYFVDSRTSAMSVAEGVAREHNVPTARRDVFLDNVREPEEIRAQFQQLIRRARKHGKAIGIAHPYPETIAVLTEELDQLEAQGVRLVTTSQIIEMHRSNIPWQASLSPSPKAVKNLKQ